MSSNQRNQRNARTMERAPRLMLPAILIVLAGGMAVGENIDPANDGSKYAWSENLGWLNARPGGPGGPGVQVSDSDLTGWAWSENAGWITFSSTGPNPYRVASGWRRAVPAGSFALTVTKAGGSNVLLSWTTVSGATTYDVVRGGLSTLHSSNGNFQVATQTCIVANAPGTSFTTGGTPSAGDGYWFLVRGRNCGGMGTYNDGSQVESRDAGIVASGNDCL